MSARLRRSRVLLTVALFFVVAIVYYHRTPSETLAGYSFDSIGGGSVLRPGEVAGHDKPEPPPASTPTLQSSTQRLNPPSTQAPPTYDATKADSSSSPAASTKSVSRVTASISSPALTHPVTLDEPTTSFAIVSEDAIPIDQDRFQPPTTTSVVRDHWAKPTENFPVKSTIRLPTQSPKALPKIQHGGKGNIAEKELAAVRKAMQHTWQGYRERAWGADEVRPVSGLKKNPFNGWGATLVDSLDTLWVMGMQAEFEEAVEAVGRIDFTTSRRYDIPLFEVTIRYLGGLLGGYDVSGHKYTTLLDKAIELAEVLFGAFDTPNRMPETYYNWRPAFASQPHRAGSHVVMAELGSLSVEFTRLAQITKKDKYYDAVARITDAFEELQNKTLLPGMWPLAIDATGCHKQASLYGQSNITPIKPTTTADGRIAAHGNTSTTSSDGQSGLGKIAGYGNPILEGSLDTKAGKDQVLAEINGSPDFSVHLENRDIDDGCVSIGLKSSSDRADTFTLGGQADSTYEYLPKQYILLGGNVEQYRSMYLSFAKAARKALLFRPMTIDERDILMSGEVRVVNDTREGKLVKTYNAHGEHLTCFVGGMFAMAGKIFNIPADVEIGAKLADGCVWAYNVTGTGIMPEGYDVLACKRRDHCPWDQKEYWERLDPYMESRLAAVPSEYKSRSKGSLPAAAAAAAAAAGPPTVGAPTRVKFTSELSKRQLEENVYDPAIDRPSAFDGPADTPYIPDPSLTLAEPEEATPLSHEEFVKQKIEDERLPPGMVSMSSTQYILRPEAIESVFYMYRISGEQKWRDAGWRMFQAIEKNTRATYGYSAIYDVTTESSLKQDSMESFWSAETLKYFYLLFDDKDTWSLDDWVLNTEAHFFRRPE